MPTFNFAFNGGTLRHVPVYDLSDWALKRRDLDQAVFRPTAVTLLRRFGWTVLAVIFLVPLFLGYQALLRAEKSAWAAAKAVPPADVQQAADDLLESMRNTMPEAEFQSVQVRLSQQAAERQRQLEARSIRASENLRLARAVLSLLAVLLGTIAVLPPLSILWNHVTLAQDMRGGLAVRSWYLLPRSRAWEPGAVGGISVHAREHTGRVRRGHYRTYGWRWCAQLKSSETNPGFAPAPVLAEFIADSQRSRPIDGHPLPPRLAALLEELSRLTGLTPGAPLVLDSGKNLDRLASQWLESPPGPEIQPGVHRFETRQTYHSLDEIPDELRPRVEEMMEAAKREGGSTTHVERSFVYRDSTGRERVFTSRDEMPPEIRQLFDELGPRD